MTFGGRESQFHNSMGLKQLPRLRTGSVNPLRLSTIQDFHPSDLDFYNAILEVLIHVH